MRDPWGYWMPRGWIRRTCRGTTDPQESIFRTETTIPARLLGTPRPKAKDVIVRHSTSGPSHIDVFDPKPQAANCDEEAAPEEFAIGTEHGFMLDQP